MAPVTIEQAVEIAVGHHRAGRLAEAEGIYRQVLAQQPDHAHVLHLLSVLAHQTGHTGAAIELMGRAIAINPDVAAYHGRLGLSYWASGQWERATACFRRVVELQPDLAEAHNTLGNALHKQGRFDEAIAAYNRAITLKPDYAEAHNNLGSARRAQGRLDEAIAACNRAITLKPSLAEAHNNLGNALQNRGRLDEAVAAFNRAITLEPDYAEAHSNLGSVRQAQGRLDEAIAACNRAITLKPSRVEAHNNLGNALQDRGQLDEAIAAYNRAITLKPDYADARFNLGCALLARGDYDQGWIEHEQRPTLMREPVIQRCSTPRWEGEPLDGKTVLMVAEQGYGDMFQFIRYARLLKDRAARVVLACLGDMIPILSSCPGIDLIIPREAPLPRCHVHVPLMSLPLILGTTLETVPAEVPYLHPDAALVANWRRRMAGIAGFRIGIVWQGTSTYAGSPYRNRSIPLRYFEALARIPGVSLVSLQVARGLDQLPVDFPIVDFGDELTRTPGRFLDTAAVMKNLDLVVTIDTATAHLAGALGLPTWVPLPCAACWRWLLDREDSPWYPTMRLFRQARPGDWTGVLERVAEALWAVVLTAARSS